ncbi:DUF6278 family protein [Streptomyces sodiiphilus]|uniref:DUF6278 family protein n=1 Tax=Streptomyces sodiiphilus TaxID=226217 RepID=A0ABN2PCQ6_9ACTN
MNLPFLDNWRKGPRPASGTAWADPEGVAQLLSDCELLRARAHLTGIELDGSPRSLEDLDQLLPVWREDPEERVRLGNDAGLYLGTVLVRTLPGARWEPGHDGGPVVVLGSGRRMDVVATGQQWAAGGSPELSQVYAEASES